MTSKVLKFLRTEERSLPFSGYNFVMRMSQSFGKHLCHMCHKEHDMHILPTSTNSTNSKNALICLVANCKTVQTVLLIVSPGKPRPKMPSN